MHKDLCEDPRESFDRVYKDARKSRKSGNNRTGNFEVEEEFLLLLQYSVYCKIAKKNTQP